MMNFGTGFLLSVAGLMVVACTETMDTANSQQRESLEEGAGGAANGDCVYESSEGQTTNVTVFNDTDSDLFLLETLDRLPGNVIVDDVSERLSVKDCLPACDAPLDAVSCGTQVNQQRARRIVPQGKVVLNWNGTYSRVRMLADSCTSSEEELSCIQKLVPTDGSRIVYEAVEEISCLEDEECSCEPDADGSCVVFDASGNGGQMVSGFATVNVTHPAGGYEVRLIAD